MSKTFKDIEEILNKHRETFKKKYGLKEIGIFGSYIREETKEDSDLDILVDFENSIDLLKFINLENYLSDILGIKVDLVMKSALKPRLGKRILREVVYI